MHVKCRNTPCGEVLVLQSQRLVSPAADHDFVIHRNAPCGQVFVLPSWCLVRHAPMLILPYCQHDSFKLGVLTGAECRLEFRFYRNSIYRLAKVLNMPDEIVWYNCSKLDRIEAFCIFLKRLPYPCRYSDIIQRCGCSVREICLTSNAILDKIFYDPFHLLEIFINSHFHCQTWNCFLKMGMLNE